MRAIWLSHRNRAVTEGGKGEGERRSGSGSVIPPSRESLNLQQREPQATDATQPCRSVKSVVLYVVGKYGSMPFHFLLSYLSLFFRSFFPWTTSQPSVQPRVWHLSPCCSHVQPSIFCFCFCFGFCFYSGSVAAFADFQPPRLPFPHPQRCFCPPWNWLFIKYCALVVVGAAASHLSRSGPVPVDWRGGWWCCEVVVAIVGGGPVAPNPHTSITSQPPLCNVYLLFISFLLSLPSPVLCPATAFIDAHTHTLCTDSFVAKIGNSPGYDCRWDIRHSPMTATTLPQPSHAACCFSSVNNHLTSSSNRTAAKVKPFHVKSHLPPPPPPFPITSPCVPFSLRLICFSSSPSRTRRKINHQLLSLFAPSWITRICSLGASTFATRALWPRGTIAPMPSRALSPSSARQDTPSAVSRSRLLPSPRVSDFSLTYCFPGVPDSNNENPLPACEDRPDVSVNLLPCTNLLKAERCCRGW